jgi:hypothetical protein
MPTSSNFNEGDATVPVGLILYVVTMVGGLAVFGTGALVTWLRDRRRDDHRDDEP